MVRYDGCCYKKRTFGPDRPREDGVVMGWGRGQPSAAKERGLEQPLPSRPSARTIPVDTLSLNF